MQFLIDKLHAMNVIDCSTIQQFCNSVCCDTRSKECAYGECNVCKEKQIVVQPGAQLDRQSFYFKWAKQQQTRPGHDNKDIVVNVTTKLRVSATMSEMLSQVNENKSEFVKHCYRIYHQYDFIRDLKENLSTSECILHIDFSENYECKYAREAQSVHFGASKQQVSMHTGVLYTANTGDSSKALECTSFCTLSDNTRHDPSAIWAHLQPILRLIAEKYPSVHCTHYSFLIRWAYNSVPQQNKHVSVFSASYLWSIYQWNVELFREWSWEGRSGRSWRIPEKDG